MYLAYTPEQDKLAAELREYFAELMTPARRAALARADGDYGDGGAYREIVRQLGADGWLTLSWPAEYGGRDATVTDQLIFTDEAAAAGVPVPFLTINTVGPTIMRFGTDQQKSFFLPKIASGELHFSIGYSEPEAGTDLAALRTRAVRDGDEYVINGQKMWTSLISYADYVWLACRTDTAAPRHKGLSIIIVPTDSPGFSWTPVPTLAGVSTSATYYSDVRVPAANLVGTQNQGWPLITNQLNHERVALTSAAPLQTALRLVRDWAAETAAPGGGRVIDAAKVYGTELTIEACRLLMEVLGTGAVASQGSPGALLAGRVERMHRSALILTFGGGTNEIQRDIIAAAALGLPYKR